jgi:hypothetical protein
MVTKEEYLDWVKNPVTQALRSAIAERINDGARELAGCAGVDPLSDRYKCGMINAYQEILTVELDELEGAKENA